MHMRIFKAQSKRIFDAYVIDHLYYVHCMQCGGLHNLRGAAAKVCRMLGRQMFKIGEGILEVVQG